MDIANISHGQMDVDGDDGDLMQINTGADPDNRPMSHNVFNPNSLNKAGDGKGMASRRHGTIKVWPRTRALLRQHMEKDNAAFTGGERGYKDALRVDFEFGVLRQGDEPMTVTQWTNQVYWTRRELGLTKTYKCEASYLPRKDSEEEVSEQLDVTVHHTPLLQEVAGACRKLLQADEGTGDVGLQKLTRLIVDSCAFNDQEMVNEIQRAHEELKAEKLSKYAAQFLNKKETDDFQVEEVHKPIKVTHHEKVQAILDCINDLPQQMHPCMPVGRELERNLAKFSNKEIRELERTASVRVWLDRALNSWCLSRPKEWDSTLATLVICMDAGKKAVGTISRSPVPARTSACST